MSLTNRNILLISPEPWDHIFVSKHHYAIHLAKRGNRVYFLNPPSKSLKIESTQFQNLSIIYYKGFTKGLRFLPSRIQRFFMRIVLEKLEFLARNKFNVIWSFDNSVFYDFTIFPEQTLTISHIVDPSQDFQMQVAAKTASICICNTDLLKSRFSLYNRKVFKINHGYNERQDIVKMGLPGVNKIKAVYCGNLDIPYLDWAVLYRLVAENSNVDFIFIGPGYNVPGLESNSAISFKQRITLFHNVYRIGKVDSDLVARYLKGADVLLICYQEDYQNDQVANAHKFMEYLGSGNAIVSTFTKEYELHRDIIAMTDRNTQLPELFKTVVNDLGFYNCQELFEKRIAFAKDNTYDKQIDRIERIIYD